MRRQTVCLPATRAIRLAAAAACCAIALSAAAQAECQLNRLAEIPVDMHGRTPTIDASANGRPIKLLVDSGAYWSHLSYAKAAELGLKLSPLPPGFSLGGIGGASRDKLTRLDTFAFSKAAFKKVDFIVSAIPGEDGVLGQNVLSLMDVEYDLSKGALRLFRLQGCKDEGLAYWSAAGKPYNTVNLVPFDGMPTMTTTYAYLNGERLRVLIDTGATVTLIKASAARRAGVNVADAEASGVVIGFGRRTPRVSTIRMDKFKLGDEEVSNAPVKVTEADLSVDMILGVDFLTSHRVFVSNQQKKIYFTYEGGPLFNTETSAYLLDGSGGLIEAEFGASEDPADSAGFALRGAASHSVGDLDAAERDYTRAIELDPNDASHYVRRARARLQIDNMDAALADIEAALKLQPDHAEALLLRAALAAENNPEEALRDAKAAASTMTLQSELRLDLAGLFVDLKHPELAIPEYSAWVDTRREDARLPFALNGRCWARALLNTDLDLALKDCDLAVKRSSGDAAWILDSRGLVHVRRGEFKEAIADYDRALAAEPKMAWSLYGRSLANRALGRTAAADRDLAAAREANPDIEQRAREFGL